MSAGSCRPKDRTPDSLLDPMRGWFGIAAKWVRSVMARTSEKRPQLSRDSQRKIEFGCLTFVIVFVIAIVDAKMYQHTEVADGSFGPSQWSAVTIIITLGAA